MQLETRSSDDLLIVTPLEKRIDVRVAAAFRRALLDRVDAGARRIVVNLEHVDFIDSSGLGALVSTLKRIGRDGDLKICSPGPDVRAVLELTRLNQIIPVFDNEADIVGVLPMTEVESLPPEIPQIEDLAIAPPTGQQLDASQIGGLAPG